MLKFKTAELTQNLDFVLSHYRIEHPAVTYLQIGAFDGVQGDPVYPLIARHKLQGVLLEPQKDAFVRLQANYGGFTGFHLINAAIADRDGQSTLYRIKAGAQGPDWLHQIASFDKNVIRGHAHMVPNLDSMIETETVHCMSFATLFDRVGLQTVDMLVIDTEGFDIEVLRLFDVPKRAPAIIRFEHKHLNTADYEESLEMLVHGGYRLTICGTDTLAYRNQVSSHFSV